MKQVFYTDDGRLYSAEKAKSLTHARMNFPTEDMHTALGNDTLTREEMLARINHPEFKRTGAAVVEGTVLPSLVKEAKVENSEVAE